MTLKEFILQGEQNVITWDFKLLYNNGELSGSSNVETICNYKLLNKRFDCDNTDLAKNICKILFPHATNTDTLNSWQIPIKRYLNYFHQDILENHCNSNSRYKYTFGVPDYKSIEGLIRKQKLYRSNSSIWSYYIKNKLGTITIYNEMEQYALRCHTLGNFMGVCKGFNMGRFLSTQDYPDLAFFHMYKYFSERDLSISNAEIHLEEFLRGSKGNPKETVVSNCVNWLNNYDSWATFVEKHYLQSFLEDSSDSNSMPKEFWSNHFDNKPTRNSYAPKEEFLKYISFVNQAILERGKAMYDALKNKAS